MREPPNLSGTQGLRAGEAGGARGLLTFVALAQLLGDLGVVGAAHHADLHPAAQLLQEPVHLGLDLLREQGGMPGVSPRGRNGGRAAPNPPSPPHLTSLPAAPPHLPGRCQGPVHVEEAEHPAPSRRHPRCRPLPARPAARGRPGGGTAPRRHLVAAEGG